MEQKRTQQLLEIARRVGVLRPRDLDIYDIPRVYLRRLHDRKLLLRVGRGLYVLPDVKASEHHTLAEACKRVPHGVLCLLTALQFHGLTTQAPFEVWMAIERKAWLPQVNRPAIRFVRFSGKALTEGVEEHRIEGVLVKVYSPAKTVVDCFRYRNKIGLDVALEALRDCRRSRRCTMDDLWHYAQICRMAKVMKPYFEAMV
ncbi:MAG: type IV toxin-antitoxin system AbiEi family antitoxin domain-containing protein [Dehalococcoidia bacterium]|nr:type IV toxin-antitoxin system AbiEi family antitoxin domain-containing protein [Dehalococcoidia bacterium]